MPEKRVLLLVLFCTFCVLNCFVATGQSTGGTLSGRVAGEGKKGLPLATVSLKDNENRELLKIATDSSGWFKITYTSRDSLYLVISYTGYKEHRSRHLLLPDMDLGAIQLVPVSAAMDEVVVQTKQNLIEVSSGTITYNVSRSIDAQGTNALDALRKAPGVSVNSDNSVTLNGKGGVLILIDGKQTYLSGKEITDLLQSMPASGIKSFEIINSPGAKYDATGSSGIINIKTNKSRLKGFNGTISSGMAYGVFARQNTDISFNYNKNRYNIYGNYNHFIGHYSYVYGSDRVQGAKEYGSFTDDIDKRKKMGTRLGIDYSLTGKSTLGVLLTGNFVFGGGITRTRTAIGPAYSSVIQQVLDAENDYYFQQTNRYNANLNYRYEDAKGRIFNVDADYGHFTKDNGNLQSNRYSDAQRNILSQNLYRSLNGINIRLKAFKIDYTTQWWKGTIEGGAKYSVIASDNSARFYHALSTQDSLDERRTNTFGFTEQIISGYLSYKKAMGKWAFQGGLRLENSSSEGVLQFRSRGLDVMSKTPIHYTNLFPSFSISVKPNERHNYSLAYSRRIDRPAYQDLNPFIYLLDELSFWQGNPFLQPQLSHRATLQYVYNNATIIGINYAYTDQYSTRITDTLEAEKIVMVPRNLGTQENISLTLTQNLAPKKWWDITFNGTVYHIHNLVSLDKQRNLELNQLAGRFSLQQRFKLPFSLIGELSGFYTTRRLIGANEISRAVSQVDVGLQKSFLDNRAVVRLAFSDLYQGSRVNSEQRFEGFYLRSYGYYETRQVKLNFTYQLSASKTKAPRTRSSGLENENTRIK